MPQRAPVRAASRRAISCSPWRVMANSRVFLSPERTAESTSSRYLSTLAIWSSAAAACEPGGGGRQWRGRDIAGLRAPHSLWQQDCARALQQIGKPGAPTASSAEARAIGSPGEPARWVGVGPSSRGLDSPTRSHGAWNFTAWDCSAGASSLSTISRRPGRQLAPRLEGRSQARWPRWDSAAMANSLRRPST